MKRIAKYLKVCFCVMAAMMLITLVPKNAQAAPAYRFINVGPSRMGKAVKVGSYYFWGEYKGNQYVLYTSKTKKTGKSTAVAKMKLLDSSCSVYTNGSYIYYISHNSTSKHTISSVKVNGKNKVNYKTVPGAGVSLMGIYGNKIYYSGYSGNVKNLYVLDKKTKKYKTKIKGIEGGMYWNAKGRYILYAYDASHKAIVKVFDCKADKVIKTNSVKMSNQSEPGIWSDLGTNYLYIAVTESSDADYNSMTYKIYRCSVDGKGKLTSVKTLKNIGNVAKITDKYIYYNTDDEATGNQIYYRYNISSKISQKMTENAYMKILE